MRSILTLNNSTWIKCRNDAFDVPMGEYDSAQVAYLVYLYILEILSRIVDPKQVGLYREDRLTCVPNSNGSLTVKLQEKLLQLLSYWGSRLLLSSKLLIT